MHEKFIYEEKVKILRGKLVWIDHHASSADIIKNDKTEILKLLADDVGLVRPDNIYAGCMLTWLYFNYENICTLRYAKDLSAIKYFISNEAPIWVQYVDDYDKWAHKMEHSTAFVTGVTSTNGGLWNNFLNPDGSYATYVSKHVDGITKKFIKKGKVIDNFRKDENTRALKGAGFVTVISAVPDSDGNKKDLTILAINRPGNSLIFGEYIRYVDAVVVYSFDGNLWNYSIFSHSSKDFPVNNVAAMFKDRYGITGGGHAHAAGWATKKCIFDDGADPSIISNKIRFKDWVKELDLMPC